MPAQPPEVQPVSPESPSYSPERIQFAGAFLMAHIDDIARAMAPMPLEQAKATINGEALRIQGIGEELYPFGYQIPIEQLQRAGHLPKKYSAWERAAADLGHLLSMNPSLLPNTYLGCDLPKAVPASKVVLELAQKERLLPKEGYSVDVEQEHTGDLFDIALQVLVAQYKGAEGIVAGGEKRAKMLDTCDIAHGPDELQISTVQEASGLTVPIMAHGEKTGFVWRVGQDLGDTRMGEAYKATLDLDPDRPYDTEKVYHVVGDTKEKETTVLVYEEAGKILIDGWGYIPRHGTNTTEDDMRLARDINQTIHDLWRYCGWEGKAILAVPKVAALHVADLWSAIRYKRLPLNTRAPANMILVNGGKMMEASRAGQLSFVGPGKRYELNDLTIAIHQGFGNGMFDRIEMLQPVNLSVTTVRSKKDLEDFVGAAQ